MTTTAVPRKYDRTIHGRRMTYVDEGDGDTVLFLHGNPTSSYLWRKIIPHLALQARCVAPDLIGMGDSDKLPHPGHESYRFVDHRHYLDELLRTLDLGERVTLVLHDWGSALGFDWARRHAERVRGIAYMEAIVQPMSWGQWPEGFRGIFQGLRSDKGEDLVLARNSFVERILPNAILRTLDEDEMNEYRRPFLEPGEDRRPTLTWPRELPIDGEPEDVVDIVDTYGKWLAHSPVPKLFVNADPGAILVGDARDFCRSWPNQEEITVAGSHFIQEDSPDAIGRALADWHARLEGPAA